MGMDVDKHIRRAVGPALWYHRGRQPRIPVQFSQLDIAALTTFPEAA